MVGSVVSCVCSVVGCGVHGLLKYQAVSWHVKTFTAIHVMIYDAHEIACT